MRTIGNHSFAINALPAPAPITKRRDKSDEMTAAYRLRAMMLRDCCSDGIAQHKANYQN
jgi:hypothetical protein